MKDIFSLSLTKKQMRHLVTVLEDSLDDDSTNKELTKYLLMILRNHLIRG